MNDSKRRKTVIAVAIALSVFLSVLAFSVSYSLTRDSPSNIKPGGVAVEPPLLAFGYDGQNGYQFTLDNSSSQTWYQSYHIDASGSVEGAYVIALINASDLGSSLSLALYNNGEFMSTATVVLSSIADSVVPQSELNQVALVPLSLPETYLSEGGIVTVAVQSSGPVFFATFRGNSVADAYAAAGGITRTLPSSSVPLDFSILAYAVVIQ